MYICCTVSTVDVNECIFCVNEQQKVYTKNASRKYIVLKRKIFFRTEAKTGKTFLPSADHQQDSSNLIYALS